MNAQVQEWLEEHEEPIMLFTGLDDALIGTVRRINEPTLAVYDWGLIVDVLLSDSPDMTYEEAVEYIDFNIAGAWMGPQTPLILNRPEWICIRNEAQGSASGAAGAAPPPDLIGSDSV